MVELTSVYIMWSHVVVVERCLWCGGGGGWCVCVGGREGGREGGGETLMKAN